MNVRTAVLKGATAGTWLVIYGQIDIGRINRVNGNYLPIYDRVRYGGYELPAERTKDAAAEALVAYHLAKTTNTTIR